MILKGCGRCGGDMFREEYIGHVDYVCLQCGNRRVLDPAPLRRHLRESAALRRRSRQGAKKVAA